MLPPRLGAGLRQLSRPPVFAGPRPGKVRNFCRAAVNHFCSQLPNRTARAQRRRQPAPAVHQHLHQPAAQQCSEGPTETTIDAGAAAAALAAAAVVAAAALLLAAGPALALAVHQEPPNALSLPTWAVHTSSVTEYIIAMGLIWQYGEVSGVPQWKGLTWAMIPSLFSAMCACTWHFHYNHPSLYWLVPVQASLSFLGTLTCWLAAYRIYKATAGKKL